MSVVWILSESLLGPNFTPDSTAFWWYSLFQTVPAVTFLTTYSVIILFFAQVRLDIKRIPVLDLLHCKLDRNSVFEIGVWIRECWCLLNRHRYGVSYKDSSR